jgi:hypothetical protein
VLRSILLHADESFAVCARRGRIDTPGFGQHFFWTIDAEIAKCLNLYGEPS